MTDTTYLDHAATTPMRPEAVEAMLPWLGGTHGNPSGTHRLARVARRAVDDARDTFAELLGCGSGDIVFTSGGTESDNTAVHGRAARGPVVASAVEHHAVLDAVVAAGGRLVVVDPTGRISLDALAEALRPAPSLVSVMLANNEVGTIQPLADVAALMAELVPDAVLHTDAVQAFPWLDLAPLVAPAALVSLSAHKFGGPTGVGVLVARRGTALVPLLRGGGQERDRRSGSHNVAGIVGAAVAARLCAEDRELTVKRVGAMRDRLADGLLAAIPEAFESGVTGVASDRAHKIAGSCHLCFDGVDSESLLFLLDQEGIAASAASSCASGAAEPSHVLAAMGIDRARAGGSLRLSLGWTTTEADVDRALAVVPAAVARARDER